MRFFVDAASIVARAATTAPCVALTIDDGPDELCADLLRVLDRARMRATFFCPGKKLDAAPEMARAIIAGGHEIENHTYSHGSALALRSRATNLRDLTRAQETLARYGARARYFRPVAGMSSPPVAAAAAELGLGIVHWTASARDGGPLRVSPERALARLMPGLVPGGILVVHDRGGQPALRLIPTLAEEAEARGLRFVSLSELLQGGSDFRSQVDQRSRHHP